MKNIAIDGPAGAGKSTIAKRVAKEIGAIYVDTGALYRTLAYHVLNSDVTPSDEDSVKAALSGAEVEVKYIDDTQHVYLNGDDISDSIRREEIGNTASIISAQPGVRKKLLDVQRNLAKVQNVVMDGRDIGTVVLPDAYLKIFLTASVDTRADRRFKELLKKNENPDIEKIKQDIIIRDKQDTEREISPLKQAEDAMLVDSSDMSIDEVVAHIIDLYQGK